MSGPSGRNHPDFCPVGEHRERIAHDFEQFVERSELTVVGFKAASKSKNDPVLPVHLADEKTRFDLVFC
jgi:hypothetical protein